MLHWSKELIQEYIVNHAHEVNHKMAVKYTHDPPPLPDNNDDKWFHQHPPLPGSGKAPRKQIASIQLRKKGTPKGGVKKLPKGQQPKLQKKSHRYRPGTVAL